MNSSSVNLADSAGCAECVSSRDNVDELCILHNRLLPDRPLLPRAFATLPSEFVIENIPGSQEEGVFAATDVAERCILGPLVGDLSDNDDSFADDDSFRYALVQQDESLRYFNLESNDLSNWMKYVRMADMWARANAVAFQQHGKIYFAVLRVIRRGEELLVRYSEQYAKSIGKVSFESKDHSAVDVPQSRTLADGIIANPPASGDFPFVSSVITTPASFPKISPPPIAPQLLKPKSSNEEPLQQKGIRKQQQKGKVVNARLRATLLVNPFQFPNPSIENNDAWLTATELVKEEYSGTDGYKPEAEERMIRDSVFRLLREWKRDLPLRPLGTQFSARDDLVRQIYELQLNQPTAVRIRQEEEATSTELLVDENGAQSESAESPQPSSYSLPPAPMDHATPSTGIRSRRRRQLATATTPNHAPSTDATDSGDVMIVSPRKKPDRAGRFVQLFSTLPMSSGLPDGDDLPVTHHRPSTPLPLSKSAKRTRTSKRKANVVFNAKRRKPSPTDDDNVISASFTSLEPKNFDHVAGSNPISSGTFLLEDYLQAVIDVNPFQYRHAVFQTAAWNSAYKRLRERDPSSINAEQPSIEELKNLVDSLLRDYVPVAGEELSRVQMLVRKIYEQKTTAHSDYVPSSTPEVEAPLPRRGDRLKRLRKSPSTEATINEEVFSEKRRYRSRGDDGTSLTDHRLRAFIAANPFQFHTDSEEHRAAWKAAEEAIQAAFTGKDGYRGDREDRNMPDTVYRLLREWKKERIKGGSTAPLTPRDQLIREVYEMKLSQPRRNDSLLNVQEARTLGIKLRPKSSLSVIGEERLRAFLRTNPYQYPAGSLEYKAAVAAATEQVVAVFTGEEEYSPEREGRNLKDCVIRYLGQWQRDRVEGQSTAPLTVRDELVQQLYALRMKRPAKDSSVKEVSRKKEIMAEHRLRACLSANPYQFAPGSEGWKAAWAAAEHVVQTAHAGEYGYHADRESRNMSDNIQRMLRDWTLDRVSGKVTTPLSAREELVQQIYELRRKQPGFEECEDEEVMLIRRRKKHNLADLGFIPYDYACEICASGRAVEFRIPELLEIHMLRHGKEMTPVPTTCPLPDCSFQDSVLSKLLDHVDKHKRLIYGRPKENKCSQCRFSFKTPEFLARHIRRMHTHIGSDRSFDCPSCSRKFVTQAALRSHARVHSGRQLFECPVCLLRFGSSREIQKHGDTHRVNGGFSCRVCQNVYPEFHILKRHLRTEHVNKRYTCDVCRKFFKTKFALGKHMLVHSAVYAFECKTCGRRFKRQRNYDDHMERLHHPDRLYSLKNRSEKVAETFGTGARLCEFCTRQYASQERLLIHQREKHLEKMPIELRFPDFAHSSRREEVSVDESSFSNSTD
ncbi:putative PR domain zinc finger protein 10 [Hypsibius exemplaris]|uniref:PR domain zinc finger protein 10 n=1 Tax=Hypsibius exemplaris TaxID=2072580 RepID=A0A1W0WMF4_HYPEX|nr:putative PR domain zinc finger protein 10 [Hypsibius exemplaris]